MRELVRPLALGYQRVRITQDRDDAAWGRRHLADFADREGFALGEVFVDADENRPLAALTAMIDAACRQGAVAVLVLTWADLGTDPYVQGILRARIQREARVVVLSAQLDTRGAPLADAVQRRAAARRCLR